MIFRWLRTAPPLFVAACLLCSATAAASAAEPKVFWGSETHEAAALEQQYLPKKGTMGKASRAMVAACHDRSVEIGVAVLRRGGNAVDAFVAVTFADYVQTPGASSIGGPMGALIYDAKSKQVASVLAPLKTVASPTGQWTVGETAQGKQVLVPGAVAGLEAMHKKYGRLAWADIVQPAAELARKGFPVSGLYWGILSASSGSVKTSVYGRATYFRSDGSPLAIGETLKLPVLAETLEAIARSGAAHLQEGPWAKAAVAAIRARGGEMSESDLASYRPEWSAPLKIDYRGTAVFGIGGHNSGGGRLLLALEILEHADINKLGHYSESLDGLETMVRISRAVSAEAPLYAYSFFDDAKNLPSLLASSRPAAVWADVVAKIDRTSLPPAGSHSYSVAVVDAEGNAVAGTHTIEALPFGSGIFVGGVPLNNTGVQHPFIAGALNSTPPGSYLIEPLSATLAFRKGELVLASSTFSSSLWPADFQLVSSIIDFGWEPERVALTPRFGGYPIDLTKMTADLAANLLDKRYAPHVVEALKQRGLSVSQQGYVDTGMLVAIKRDPKSKALTGFTPEQLPEGRAAGY